MESALGRGNLYDERNLRLLTAVQDALHAHALLRTDVDYIVKKGAVELVDEFKGRIAMDRRWPAGLHAAIEAKEKVAAKQQGVTGANYAAASDRFVSERLRDDGNGVDEGARVRESLWAGT